MCCRRVRERFLESIVLWLTSSGVDLRLLLSSGMAAVVLAVVRLVLTIEGSQVISRLTSTKLFCPTRPSRTLVPQATKLLLALFNEVGGSMRVGDGRSWTSVGVFITGLPPAAILLDNRPSSLRVSQYEPSGLGRIAVVVLLGGYRWCWISLCLAIPDLPGSIGVLLRIGRSVLLHHGLMVRVPSSGILGRVGP